MEIEEAKRRARSGPRLLLARRAFALILTFVSTVTVARLVSPVEYGLANMALVVLGFAQIFRDFGLTNAVMRKGVISQEEMSFIFWFNAATTVALALVMAALSPLAARFYHEPIVASVILVSLLGFVLSGLSSQHRALMTRDLRFGAIAAIDTVGMVAGFITTLTLAALYHNVWSIVFGMFAQALVGAVVNVWLSGWHPGPPKRIDDLSSLLKFAANSSVFSISVFLSNSAAPVLIGHFLGAGPLGQFNRADTLFRLPMVNLIQPITQATMPLLTRLRAVPEEYRIAYIGLVRKLCTVLFPASVILTFVSISLVQALLGSRWEVAGHVLTALAPTLVAIAVASAASDLFVTQDRAAELRSLGLGETVLRVGAIVVAVRYGVVAAALTFTVTTMIAAVVRVVVAGRKGPVTTGDQLKATLPSIPIAIGSGAACFAAQLFSHAYLSTSTETAAMILTSGMAGGLVLAVCLRSSRAAVTEILEIFGIGRLVRKRKHSA